MTLGLMGLLSTAAAGASTPDGMDPLLFLKALACVLCVAALTTVVFQWVRLPVVLGYVLAGMVVGPYIPIPIVADRHVVTALSELGVTLLMFSLGLEFSLRKLVRVGPTAGLIMLIEVSTMLGVGYLVGRLLGWRPLESLFAGAIVSISSTMMIAKSFSQRRPDRSHVELVFGVLVFEDLMAILLLATLTTLTTGQLAPSVVLGAAGRLALFLLSLVVVGLLLIPRLVRKVAQLGSDETLLVLCVGLCSAVALLAHVVGYSVALGAFVCGSLVSESGEGRRIEPLIHPLRDLFGAVFFVSVGMSIDPAILLRYWREGALLTAVVISGKVMGVSLGALLTGHSLRASVQASMTLAQIGEFSFILAGLGAATGATRDFLYPVAVGVSTVTGLLTPALVAASGPVASYLDRRLPRRLQQFLSLYAAWVERLRTQQPTRMSQVRRHVALLLLDLICLAGLYIVAAWSQGRVRALLLAQVRLPSWAPGVLLILVALVLSMPFWLGLLGTSRRLADVLAMRVIPPAGAGEADLGAAPRRALSLSLQLLTLLCIEAPLLATTGPFLPPVAWSLLLLLCGLLIALAALSFWRSASQLLGHVRAGAETVVELLAAQSHAQPSEHSPIGSEPHGDTAAASSAPALHSGTGEKDAPTLPAPLLAGLGDFYTHHVGAGDACIGRSLAALNLRGLTGATLIAIRRENGSVTSPGAHDVLQLGDALALVGNAQALEQARQLLRGPPAPPSDAPELAEKTYEFFALIDES